MKLIEPQASLITEVNPFKKIELAGRTCYKSEKNITEESALKFFNVLAQNKHTAMMEHATFIFRVPKEVTIPIETESKYINITPYEDTYWISGNLRAICEDTSELGYLMQRTLNEEMPGIAYNLYENNKTPEIYAGPLLEIMNNEELFKTKDDNLIRKHYYTTMRFVCDRGVTHELVRHRPSSYGQESTRYVKYELNEDMLFVEPSTWDIMPTEAQHIITEHFKRTEEDYRRLRELGLQAQQARVILDTGIKTEIVVTTNDEEWNHIFNLRYYGTTGKPHPDMQLLAGKAYPLYMQEKHKHIEEN